MQMHIHLPRLYILIYIYVCLFFPYVYIHTYIYICTYVICTSIFTRVFIFRHKHCKPDAYYKDTHLCAPLCTGSFSQKIPKENLECPLISWMPRNKLFSPRAEMPRMPCSMPFCNQGRIGVSYLVKHVDPSPYMFDQICV